MNAEELVAHGVVRRVAAAADLAPASLEVPEEGVRDQRLVSPCGFTDHGIPALTYISVRGDVYKKCLKLPTVCHKLFVLLTSTQFV